MAGVIIVSAIALLGISYLLLRLQSARKASQKISEDLAQQVLKYDNDLKQWNDYVAKARAEIQRLSRFASVADADAQAKMFIEQGQRELKKANADAQEIIARAEVVARDLRNQSEIVLSKSKEEAGSISAEARAESRRLRDEARAVLESATQQSSKIIASAHERAEEIAGSAYTAMNNAQLYERTVKAMKNIIEGYGDQYLVPAQSMLDDLAVNGGREVQRV